ncbi:MAG: ArgR family transcriptional regulator [Lactobacillales bacterium]|jgi:transcriptional regulator of arginine metabolism|nr:ArgR family transcriptional regulator [Lactobacillales bacterium]
MTDKLKGLENYESTAKNKKERQRLIRRAIRVNEIDKQEELVNMLNERGFKVTQATVSRDIKELNLIKVPNGLGGYSYKLPPEENVDVEGRIDRILNNSVISVERLRGNLAIKTTPGTAMAAKKLIAQQQNEWIFSSISDDEDILLIFKDEDAAIFYEKTLQKYL